MTWLVVAVIAYIVMAIVNVADKFILEHVVSGPRTYTFLVGASGAAVIVLAPWFLHWPGAGLFLFNLLVGSFFAAGIFFLYSALKGHDASQIFTLVGGTVPIFTIILSIIFFHEIFTLNQWLAVSCLILGTMTISAISPRHSVWYEVKKFLHIHFEKRWHSILFSFISALFFALFWFGSKVAYNSQEFLSAFIWIRLGTFVAVLCLLVSPHNRREIVKDLKKTQSKKQNKFIFIGTQLGGALGSILQNYAVALGSVALVTSLQGLQYGLILAFTYFITIFYPKIIKEKQSRKIMVYKVTASLLVALGLFYMSK